MNYPIDRNEQTPTHFYQPRPKLGRLRTSRFRLVSPLKRLTALRFASQGALGPLGEVKADIGWLAEGSTQLRKVIDTNSLQDQRLERYLVRDRRNIAVIPDAVLMETFKKNAVVSADKSTAILRRFARQTVILKRPDKILRINTRSSGLGPRMIDSKQTAAFQDFSSFIARAKQPGLERAYIEETQQDAESNMAFLLENAKHFPGIFKMITGLFTHSELVELRDRSPRSASTQTKLLDLMFQQTRVLYSHGEIEEQYWPKSITDATNTFAFRYALCVTLLFSHWVAEGRQMAKKPEKIVNDIVDVNVAAMATFFDGVLSNDARVSSIHSEARYVLSQIGAYLTRPA